MMTEADGVLRVVFMGTPELACPTLQALVAAEGIEVIGVVTQPDRPKGRKQVVSPCPVRELAIETGLETYAPESINTPESIDRLREWAPDLIIVVAYGQILRPAVLETPPMGCINIHTSLLPRYRGASPIQAALLNGDSETGVSIMYMDEGMDTGDVICTASLAIEESDNAGTLHDKLAGLGATALLDGIASIRNGSAEPKAQDDAQASYAGKISKKDGEVDWALPARTLWNRIRAFTPWPGAQCRLDDADGTRLKIVSAAVVDGAGGPGEILRIDPEGPVIATGEGALKLLEVQPPGRTIMSGSAYLCGHPLEPGQRMR